jgi:hypothetical protein
VHALIEVDLSVGAEVRAREARSEESWRKEGGRQIGAMRFHEVAGGLNQMSIRRFERLVANGPLRFEAFEAVPIRAARRLHCHLTREFFSSLVRSTLVQRSRSGAVERRLAMGLNRPRPRAVA